MYTSKVYNFLLENVFDKNVFSKFHTKIMCFLEIQFSH